MVENANKMAAIERGMGDQDRVLAKSSGGELYTGYRLIGHRRVINCCNDHQGGNGTNHHCIYKRL